ncbi:MAG: FtsX-like permease family protein [Acidimicrobiia bacterium]|nr:FtsX-like permease family protein [Acidimicrobiia bacterium]
MRLALREMRRAKVRFGMLMGAVGLLVFLILFQQTLLTTLLNFFSGALENQSAQVVVYNEEARKNLEGSVVTPEQVAQTAGVRGVARAEPLGQGSFTVRTSEETLDASIFGYVLGGPGAPTRLEAGRLPRGAGEGVASDTDAGRGLAIGDRVQVLGPDGNTPIRIVGLASESRFSVDPSIFVSYRTFEATTRTKNPDAALITPSVVAVTAASGVDPEVLASRITRQVPGVEALDRATAVVSLPGVSGVTTSFNIILTLAFIVVTLVIGIFFVILTVQKANALTLLRAIGAGTGYLTRALLVQVFAVVIGGVAIGAALLALAALGSSPDFPISFDLGTVLTRGALVAVLAVIASLAAIRRVLRLDPVEATVPMGATR